MNFRNTLLAAALFTVTASASADAVLTLDDLNDGVAATEISDGEFNIADGEFDFAPQTGIIQTNFSSADWTFAGATGFSDGQAADPAIMDLGYTLSGTGSIAVTYTDLVEFTSASVAASMLLDGNAALTHSDDPGTATITANVYDDGTLVGTASETLSGGSYSLSDDFDFTGLSNLVTLEIIFSTDSNVAASITSGDFLVAVPAPATLALFGLGLAGLGLARRKQS